MSLLIQSGEIITADKRYQADIYIEDETITEIGENLSAPEGTEASQNGLGLLKPQKSILRSAMASPSEESLRPELGRGYRDRFQGRLLSPNASQRLLCA